MIYLLVIRDNDGAILGSQRGVETFTNQNPDHDMGPFGDTPFATATTLKPGYSSTLVEVIQPPPPPEDVITVVPPNKPPRSPEMYWNGTAVVPSSETFQDTYLDAVDPQRIRDRRRDAAISELHAHPDDPVDAECMLRLFGEID